jgi:hypothetical protein
LVAPSLLKFGFVKHSVWADIDGDDDLDLLLAAEWKPITILINEGGKIESLPLEIPIGRYQWLVEPFAGSGF